MTHSRERILKKSDPRKNLSEVKSDYTTNLISAAHKGDLEEIKRYLIKGVNINQGDYDGRTALHLAAAEGHENCVHFLLSKVRTLTLQTDGDRSLRLMLKAQDIRILLIC